jgi:hypothetical protein
VDFTACFFLDSLTLEDEGTLSIIKVRNHTERQIPGNLNLASFCHMYFIFHS